MLVDDYVTHDVRSGLVQTFVTRENYAYIWAKSPRAGVYRATLILSSATISL